MKTIQNSQKVCETNFIRPTAAKEARRLRQQLTNLVNGLCKPSQQVLLDPQMDEPTDSQSNLIRYIYYHLILPSIIYG